MGAGGRLNLFQRMMLRWRDLHPYNPVHVVRVPAALEPERLRACIGEWLESCGLTGLAVDHSRWRFRYEGGPAAVELTIVPGGSDPLAQLSRTIESEFNRPFTSAPHENPFRFFAIDEAGGFQLALVYDHYVAGGDSIARLLTGIACSLAADEVPATPAPVRRHPATYRSVFLRHPLWALRAVAGLPRTITGARRSYRPRYADVQDGHNGFSYLRIGPPQRAALLGTAKAWGVTLNELLMASMLLALSPLAAQRRQESRRTELAVASILNMRRDFRADAQDVLSPLLAAFRVSHAVPDGIGLQQLAQEVHAQAVRTRRGRLYLGSLVALGVSALLWPLLSVAQRHGLYPKHFPVWAGITSLDLNPIWARAGCKQVPRLDYLRAVPTGPLCPMVFAVTTAHDTVHVGIAFRTSAFPRAAVEGLAAAFLQAIAQLRMEPSP